jgi:transposase
VLRYCRGRRPGDDPLRCHGRVEPKARSRPVPEADHAQLLCVRVDPAAVDAEALGDLARSQEPVDRLVAADQLCDLAREDVERRRVHREIASHRHAVELLKRSGKSVPQLAAELGVSPQSLRNWSRQIDVDEGRAEGLSSDEREELRRLRRENRILTEEREILKKSGGLLRQGRRDPVPSMTLRSCSFMNRA